MLTIPEIELQAIFYEVSSLDAGYEGSTITSIQTKYLHFILKNYYLNFFSRKIKLIIMLNNKNMEARNSEKYCKKTKILLTFQIDYKFKTQVIISFLNKLRFLSVN